MSRVESEKLVKCIDILEARDTLKQMRLSDFQSHYREDARKAYHDEVSERAYPGQGHRREVSEDEFFSR